MPEEYSQLISSAREYFAEDFPNRSREGCPGLEELDGAIGSGRIPEDGLRAHLFRCSDCFAYVKAGLDARPGVNFPRVAWWRFGHAAGAGGRVLAYAALLIVTCLAGWVGWGLFLRGPKAVAPPDQGATAGLTAPETVTTPTPGPSPTPASPQPVKTPALKDSGRGNSQSPNESGPALAASLIRIDLRTLSVLRGAGDAAGEHVVRAEQSLNRLSIRLPTGGPAGPYAVSVEDAYGETVTVGRARSRDGETVALVMDMRKIPPKRYRLCISHAEGAPSCLPLDVTAGRQGLKMDKP